MNVHERAEALYGQDEVRIYTVRRDRVLAKLQMLSNGTTSSPVDHARPEHPTRGAGLNTRPDGPSSPRGGRASGSKAPPGVVWPDEAPDAADRPPSKDRSLYDHYRWRFEREVGVNIEYGHRLCNQAMRDYRTARGASATLEESGARDRRIIREYRGMAPVTVADMEHVTTYHVMRLREEYKLDPMSGLDPLRDDTAEVRDALLGPALGEGSSKLAQDFLRMVLADGPVTANAIFDLARRSNISARTIQRVKKTVGVRSVQNGGGWVWVLEAEDRHTSPADATDGQPLPEAA